MPAQFKNKFHLKSITTIGKRKTAVAKAYTCKHEEIRPLALVYVSRLAADPAELAAFTAENPAINAAWLGNFLLATKAISNIVPTATIKKENSDHTLKIGKTSKLCVSYGTRLSYWLEKICKEEPGKIKSFGVIAANDKMRSGDTEGMLESVQNVINQIIKNQADLAATAWAVSNLTDYQNLLTNVEALNTEQEKNKLDIPGNTDAAVTLRNTCYSYIQTILKLNNIVHKEGNPEKHRSYQVTTLLKQIRSASAPKPAISAAAA